MNAAPMIGRFADWFNNRRWFIRYLLYTDWCLLVTLGSLVAASALFPLPRSRYHLAARERTKAIL